MSLPRSEILNRGFTLVEMVVVVSIFIIMTTVLLANLPAFQDKTALDLVAEEVAITIRQAQVFGTSTRTAGLNQQISSFPSYGLHFNLANSTSFILFADKNGNNRYNGDDNCSPGQPSECQERFIFQGGVQLVDLRFCNFGNCLGYDDPVFDIIFTRPNFDATFAPPSAQETDPPASYVNLIISSVRSGATRTIVVWNTGHIYVTNP